MKDLKALKNKIEDLIEEGKTYQAGSLISENAKEWKVLDMTGYFDFFKLDENDNIVYAVADMCDEMYIDYYACKTIEEAILELISSYGSQSPEAYFYFRLYDMKEPEKVFDMPDSKTHLCMIWDKREKTMIEDEDGFAVTFNVEELKEFAFDHKDEAERYSVFKAY